MRHNHADFRNITAPRYIACDCEKCDDGGRLEEQNETPATTTMNNFNDSGLDSCYGKNVLVVDVLL